MIGQVLTRSHTRRDVIRGVAGIGLTAPLAGTRSASTLAQDAATAAAGQTWPQQSERISYGEDDPYKQAFYVWTLEPRERPRPGLVSIHGGGFIYGDANMGLNDLKFMAEAGYVTFTVGYRLMDVRTGTNIWPTQLDDVQRAIRWIRAHAADFNLDPDRICAFGHSSGGTLAAYLGTMETRDNSDPALAAYSSRVTCVLDISGDADFTLPYPPTLFEGFDTTELNTAWFGGTLEEKREVYEAASPVNHVDGDTVPFMLVHGLDDGYIPDDHPRLMIDALNEHGIEAVCVQWAKTDHQGALYSLDTWGIVPVFLARQLRPEQ